MHEAVNQVAISPVWRDLDEIRPLPQRLPLGFAAVPGELGIGFGDGDSEAGGPGAAAVLLLVDRERGTALLPQLASLLFGVVARSYGQKKQQPVCRGR